MIRVICTLGEYVTWTDFETLADAIYCYEILTDSSSGLPLLTDSMVYLVYADNGKDVIL